MNARLIQLFLIMFFALGVYFIFLYYDSKTKKEIAPTLLTISRADGDELKETCLTGNQSEKSRICPDIIREGNLALDILAPACLKFQAGAIYYLGKRYECKNERELRNEIRDFTKALYSN